MEAKRITEDMRNKLREGFPIEAYSRHPTKTFLTTLKAMYVTERLNDVFGIGRWTIIIEIIERTNDYVLVQGEFKSTDFDVSLPKQYGGHQTTGKNVEIADGYKSAVTDCQSKIASYLEIGIDLFKGKISLSDNNKEKTKTKPTNNQTNFEAREITKSEVDKWNGKIYGGNAVYVNNIKVIPPVEQIEKLKLLPNYKPDEKK